MKFIRFGKIVSVFFGALLLSACGGGGSGAQDAGMVSAPDSSDAIVARYAGSYGDDATPLASGGEFVIFGGGDNATHGSHYVVAEGTLGTNNWGFVTRETSDDFLREGEFYTSTFGTLVANSQAVISLQTSHATSSLTININNDRSLTFLRNGESHTVAPAAGYNFYTYARQVSTFLEGESVSRYNNFIAAEYVAMNWTYDTHNNRSINSALHGIVDYMGRLTQASRLPSAGVLSYNLGQAVGVYETGVSNIDALVLFGSGDLTADFDSGSVGLNLTMDDMFGNGFVDIDIDNLHLDPALNKFYDSDASVASFFYDDDLNNDGFDDTRYRDAIYAARNNNLNQISIQGYFFGPNGEEVGGGMCLPFCNAIGDGPNGRFPDSVDENGRIIGYEFLDISFIGKQQP